MATIADTVLDLVRRLEWWPRRPEKIALDTEFHRDLGAGFLEMAELVIDIEDEFLIEIGEQDRLGWVSVRDCVQYVAGREDATL